MLVYSFVWVLLATSLLCKTGEAFSGSPPLTAVRVFSTQGRSSVISGKATSINGQSNNGLQQQSDYPTIVSSSEFTRPMAGGVVATMISAATFAVPTMSLLLLPASASATVTADPIELSKGAFVIQTASESLLKSTIDSKSLLKTVFTNRKELSASFGRIQSVISSEIQNPAWKNVLREILEVEDDLAGSVRVSPPSDVRETLKDVASGKLNFLINGEIVNVAVDPSFGENEDELKVTIRGFKQGQIARTLPTMIEPRYGPIRTYFSKYERFWSWLATPFPSQYLLPGMTATNGGILVAGTAGTIWLIYLSAYGYYQYEREQELLASREKKSKVDAAARAKKQRAGEPAEKLSKKILVDETTTSAALAEGFIQPTALQQEEQLPEKEHSSVEDTPADQELKDVIEDEGTTSPKKKVKRRLGGLLFWRK